MLAETLARFVCTAQPEASAVQMMRLSLLDWAACGIAGRDEPVAQIVRKMVLTEGGQGDAVLFGGGTAPPRGAALVNGTISHALDYDDTHFAHIGHPSVAVIPAALAVPGEDFDAFLEACLIGAELSVRVGVWLGRGHYQTGFHQTATAGAFGATAAAGRLLQLNETELAQAFGLVSTRASGLKSQFGTMGKPFNAGIAASNGVEAALLAQAGFVSTPEALDGPQGFGPTHHGAGDKAAFEGMGQDWLFETVSHKFHACCHGLHAMLEAMAQVKVDPEAVQRVNVRTHPRWLSVCNIAVPETGLEAKFSYRVTAAMALLGISTAAMSSYADALVTAPKVAALRDKVEVIGDESLAETESVVSVDAGTVQEPRHDLATPLDLATRKAKLLAKAEALIGDAGLETLRSSIDQRDLPALRAALTRV